MSSGKNLGSGMEDDCGSIVASDDTFVFDAEVMDVEVSVENERMERLNSQEGEIVVDSDDDDEGVDGTEEVGARDGLSCHEIEKRQQPCTGYLLRNVRRDFRQSARQCPLTDWKSKADPYPMDGVINGQGQTFNAYNTVALAENEALVDSRNKVNMDNDRQNQTVSSGMEEIESKNTVKGILSRDELDENKVIPTNDPPVVTSDHELARLCNIESQEPGDSSQSNALDVIDRYLSAENLNFSEKDSTTKSSTIIYPPLNNAKGCQSLARRVNLKTARESGAFDWDEEQTGKGECLFLRKGKQLTPAFRGRESQTVTLQENSDFQKCSDIQPDQNPPGHMLSVEKPGPRIMADGIEKVPLISEMIVETNMSNKLDGELDVGSLELQLENDRDGRDVADWLDVGFETQLAAEAMEALLHAPPNNKAIYAHGGSSDITEKSSEVVATNRSGNITSFNSVFPKSIVSGRRSKRSAKKNENITRSLLNCGQYQGESISSVAAKKKGKEIGPSTETNLVYEEYNIQRRFCRHKSKQRKSSPETNYFKKIVDNQTSSKSDSSNREILGGNLWNFSVTTKRKRCQPSYRSSRVFQDPAKPSEGTLDSVLEFEVSKKRKEASSLTYEDQKKLKTKGNHSRLVSDLSSEVTESNKVGVQVYPDTISTASLLQLDCWSCPKKKRTRVSFKCPSNGSIPQFTPSELEEKIKMQPNENNKSVKRIAGPLLVYTRRLKSTSEKKDSKTLSKQNSSAHSSLGVNTSTSAVASGCIVPAKNCKESSKHSSESDNMTYLHTIHDSENMKFVEGSRDHSRAQTNYRENEESTLTRKKDSRSLLMKELSRLGYADSIPDFMPKSCRRRRGVANVCVLFSQNIDATTIRQQKKILARLGFSEASCCSDATHFVSGKFVRTRNMLEAIALGKPVVTPSWLESCCQAGYLIDERSYILTDAKKEKEIGFCMSVSLARARQHPLLHGQRVLITPNVKPNKDLIQILVNAVQGEEVQEIEQDGVKYDTIPQDTLILSSEEDYAMCVPFLEKGIAIYSSELLLDGIVTQKLQYQRHQLFTDFVRKN